MQGLEQADVPAPLSRLVHDLNQPLSAISTYAHTGKHLIDNGVTDPAQLKELFEKIALQCTRATALSRELGKALQPMPPGKDPS
jgi:phosphoglycerate-specific signal transduction histidine kinase